MRRLPIASFAIALIVATVALPLPAPAAATAKTTTQLPRNVRPTHYDIALVPDAQALTFAGKVSIALEVLEPTASITLNALDLTIQSARLSGPSNASYPQPHVQIDDAAQTATFTFGEKLAKGNYRLDLQYRGKIGTQANGLFAIDYDTAAGRKRALYTQFENSDARRMIPSWDEPAPVLDRKSVV